MLVEHRDRLGCVRRLPDDWVTELFELGFQTDADERFVFNDQASRRDEMGF